MDNVENLIIEHLRAIRADLGILREDVRELKGRMGNIELGQANLMSFISHQGNMLAQQQAAQDRQNARIERIERRLELDELK